MNKKTQLEELAENLLHEGFQTIVQSEQKFNVVCVTKRHEPEVAHFHRPIVGEVVVKHLLSTRGDITFSRTVVTFGGRDHDLEYIRSGLSGSALVIGIRKEDEFPYNVWELYTDTPTANPVCPKAVTSGEIRIKAQRAVAEVARYAGGGW